MTGKFPGLTFVPLVRNNTRETFPVVKLVKFYDLNGINATTPLKSDPKTEHRANCQEKCYHNKAHGEVNSAHWRE